MTKLAVIGWSGQVATALRVAAAHECIEVACMGRPHLDVADAAGLRHFVEKVRPGLIVNASGYTAVDKAESEPEEARRVNVSGVAALAHVCRDHEIPLVHLSTDFVFDGLKRTPYQESDPVAPLGVYGVTKAEGEEALRRNWSRHIILRVSWVYSEHGNNFLKTMLRLGRERRDLGIVDDQRGSPTSAQDIAEAIVRLVPVLTDQRTPDPWGTYHLTGEGETTWFGFASEIFAQAARYGATVPAVRPIATQDYPVPARRPGYSVLDNSLFRQTFGFGLPGWREGTARCLQTIFSQQETAAS